MRSNATKLSEEPRPADRAPQPTSGAGAWQDAIGTGTGR
ncbi:hypothetical protein CU044_1489 [Streptomyces sp. L-9-10]|nr:hypothetical protein CU044_1489 [Streptomyces sp. L-9-10]